MRNSKKSIPKMKTGGTPLQRARTVALGTAAVAVAAAVVPALTRVPVLSSTAFYAAPLAIPIAAISTTMSAAAMLALRKRDTPAGRVVVGIAAVAAIASGVLAARQAALARRLGAPLSLIPLGMIRPNRDRADVEIDRYTSGSADEVGLSIWRARKAEAGDAPAPTIVGIHGGAWTQGNRHDLAPFMRRFADEGFLAISVSYSLSDENHARWDEQERQIADALVWIGKNAKSYGGDIGRLVLAGASAGGNLAFNVASKAAAGVLEHTSPHEIPPVTVLSIVVGASDVAAVWNDSDPIHRKLLHTELTKHLGGSPTEYPDHYAAMSSIDAITSETPPTLWLYGANDHVVPVSSSERMLEALRIAGVPHEAIRVPFGDHSAVFGPSANVWQKRTIGFLEAHSKQ